MKRSREPEEEAKAAGRPTAHTDESVATTSPAAEVRVSKIAELDESVIVDQPSSVAMKCSLPGHEVPLIFKSYHEYEVHYIKAHTNRCSECGKNFPSEHFLNLHIEECHDAIAAVLREKGEHTYSCLVEGCDRKCGTPQKRRLHLIDKHLFPKNYFFAVTKEGIDGRSSLLLEGGHHRRRSSTSHSGGHRTMPQRQSIRAPDALQTESETKVVATEKNTGRTNMEPSPKANVEGADADMADLTSAMSTLQFVPTSVRFGRGRGRTGFAKQ